MKKVIIALAVVLTAVVTQAAALSWTISTVVDSSGNAASAGWTIALYDASTTFDIDKARAGELAPLYTAETTVSTKGVASAANSKVGSYAIGETVNAYVVVFNGSIDSATEYLVSGAKSATVGDAGKDITLAFGSMTSTSATSAFAGATWKDAGGVPEPTSGLLLLVGGAMLALRRRRRA